MDTAEPLAVQIDVNFMVMVAEALDEMVGVFFPNVFDTEIINNETKPYGAPCMTPEAWGVVYWCIAIAPEEMDHLFFGQDAGLGKTVHSVTYLHVDFAVTDNVLEFVVCDDVMGEGGDGDEHVFVILNLCAKIVVFNVQAEPTSTWGRKCAVHEYLESCHVGYFHTQIARVIDEVAAYGDVCAVRFSFLGTVAADKTCIGR